jgi:hypothetical protein
VQQKEGEGGERERASERGYMHEKVETIAQRKWVQQVEEPHYLPSHSLAHRRRIPHGHTYRRPAFPAGSLPFFFAIAAFGGKPSG